MRVNLYEAKTQLSSLVERARAGEEIIIAKGGKPVARLVAQASDRPRRKPGRGKGRSASGPTSTLRCPLTVDDDCRGVVVPEHARPRRHRPGPRRHGDAQLVAVHVRLTSDPRICHHA
jgi:prevent-host-death family protein